MQFNNFKHMENIKILSLSILVTIIMSIGLYASSQTIIVAALLLFTLILLFSKKKMLFPLLLFFLPWSPVLKISPDSFTFFTIVIPLVFIFMLIQRRGLEFKKTMLVLISTLIVYTLITKLAMNSLSISSVFSYTYFIFLLFFIPFYLSNFWKELDFKICALFMTSGVLTACFSSMLLLDVPEMSKYINVDIERAGFARLSGFYGDPNFYSAQIIMTIAVIITLITKSNNKIKNSLLIGTLFLLIYFGLLSVSKMFLLSLTGIFILWGISFMIQKQNIVSKLTIYLLILSTISFIFFSNVFSTQIDQYIYRFTNHTLTTGRFDLQIMYIEYLRDNPNVLFFGNGTSNAYVNSRAAHNTFLQIVWQLGILGSLLLVIWQRISFAPMKVKEKLIVPYKLVSIILISAYFLPWFALDFMYFDEFFYYLIMTYLGINFLKQKEILVEPHLDRIKIKR
ncbi:O-antigen ligase family protein [Planococcus sp. X10-3]|uniref:O-antigen ligase family protein n=1 Tax=Planococcus sp. X10-3 TaxID=3061240 RepID=UPI003BAFEF7E